jgi:hypothetical protein
MSVFMLAPMAALVLLSPHQQADTGRGLGMLARLGATYSVGGASKFAFRLDEAHYTLRLSTRDSHTVARRGMKLLVLKYSLTNKEPHSVAYAPNLVNLRVVTADGRSSPSTNLSDPSSDPHDLKSGGSATEMAVIELPAAEPSPRLEANVSGSATLRFDLNSFAKPLKDPFVAPDGAIRDELDVSLGKRTPLSGFDVTVNRIEWSNRSTPDLTLGPGQRALIATVTLNNQTPYSSPIDRGVLVPEIRLSDDKKVHPAFVLLQANTDERPTEAIGPHKGITIRYAIRVDEGVKADELLFTDGVNAGRSLVVDL